jgi:hypothetical protein
VYIAPAMRRMPFVFSSHFAMAMSSGVAFKGKYRAP